MLLAPILSFQKVKQAGKQWANFAAKHSLDTHFWRKCLTDIKTWQWLFPACYTGSLMRRAEFPFHEEQGEFLEQADEPRLCRASAHAQLLHSWNMVNLFLIQLNHFVRHHLMLWCTEISSCDTFWWRQKLLFEFSLSPTLSQTNCFLFNREYNSSKGTPHRRKFLSGIAWKGGGGPCPIF